VTPARAERIANWVILLGSAAILVLAVAMTPSDEATYVFGWQVPSTCVWRNLLGIRCPGCGLTRSFVYLADGRLFDSFRMHPLGPVFFAVVAVQVPLRAVRLWRERKP
jgi:hypothetical protein